MSLMSNYFVVALMLFGIGYMAVRKRVTWRTIYVVVFSLFVYYKMAGLYLLLLLGVALSDYLIAYRVADCRTSGRSTRGWVALSSFINIAILVYFTASNFIATSINDLYGSGTLDWTPVVKVGIRHRCGTWYNSSTQTLRQLSLFVVVLPKDCLRTSC